MKNLYLVNISSHYNSELLDQLFAVFKAARLNIENLKTYTCRRHHLCHFFINLHSEEQLVSSICDQIRSQLSVEKVFYKVQNPGTRPRIVCRMSTPTLKTLHLNNPLLRRHRLKITQIDERYSQIEQSGDLSDMYSLCAELRAHGAHDLICLESDAEELHIEF